MKNKKISKEKRKERKNLAKQTPAQDGQPKKNCFKTLLNSSLKYQRQARKIFHDAIKNKDDGQKDKIARANQKFFCAVEKIILLYSFTRNSVPKFDNHKLFNEVVVQRIRFMRPNLDALMKNPK